MADKSKRKTGLMRLDKFLVEMGNGTRSQVKEMVKKGRVQVNGQVVKASDIKIDPETDSVLADNRAVEYARMEYYMLNKPKGVVSATEDKKYPTVVSLIEDALRGDLFPVGRLDLDTEGLLLITNDGELAHNLLSPRKHVDKVYLAHISGRLEPDAEKRFGEGIRLEDGAMTLPAGLERVGVIERAGATERVDMTGRADMTGTMEEVRITIREGKFHQIKRMFEALGCRVEYLKRLSMGPLELDPKLEPGQYRPLTPEEETAVKDCGNRQTRV